MMKNKVLPRYILSFILQQMLGLTFLCVISFLEIYIKHDIEWLKIGMFTFAFLVIIAYEFIIIYYYRKQKEAANTEKEKLHKRLTNNELYLWFLMLLLLDLVLIAAIISKYMDSYHMILIAVSVGVFYLITVFARPYFGVHLNHKNQKNEKK